MEIRLADKDKVAFSTLELGDVFLYNGVHYMKFYSSDRSNANAVNLNGTYTMSITDLALVSPVKGYFMVVSE